ncbi:MAG TPA: DUF6055 domain-containing protein [bacterium]|nr:DUF6055 domain-containing protein [bacterium]
MLSHLENKALKLILFVFLLPAFVFPAIASFADESSIVDNYLKFYAPEMLDSKSAARTTSEQTGHRTDDPTLAHLDLVRNWDSLSESSKQKLEPVITLSDWRDGKRTVGFGESGSSCSNYISAEDRESVQSEHFIFYYTLVGQDAVENELENGIPVYINKMIQTFEKVWNHEIDVMGLPAPPLSADNKYHVNVCDVFGHMSGVLAYTNTYVHYSDYTAVSFIEIDNDYTNSGIHLYNNITEDQLVEVIAAHEFFHAIQFGMNYDAPTTWFLEMNAVWMEEEVFPDVDDYIPQYLDYRFRNTDEPIDKHSGLLAYGSAIFLRYITEHITGPDYVVDMWYDLRSSCLTPSNYTWCNQYVSETPMIDSSLSTYGKQLEGTFRDYAVAIYEKDFVDGSQSYFPDVLTSNMGSSYPISDTWTLDHLSSQYYKLSAPDDSSTYGLQISFTGESSAEWAVSVITGTEDNYSVNHISITNGSGNTTISGLGSKFNEAVLVINNVHKYTNTATYSFTANLVTECSTQQQSSILSSGWHLISLPFIPSGNSASALNYLDALDNSVNGTLIAYDTQNQQLVYDIDSAFPGIGETGRGFWLYLEDNAKISADTCENIQQQESIELKQGWNIIGNPFDSNINWSDTDIEINLPGQPGTYTLQEADDNGWINSTLYQFNGTDYDKLNPGAGNTVSPWSGYWIYVFRNVTLIINE